MIYTGQEELINATVTKITLVSQIADFQLKGGGEELKMKQSSESFQGGEFGRPGEKRRGVWLSLYIGTDDDMMSFQQKRLSC